MHDAIRLEYALSSIWLKKYGQFVSFGSTISIRLTYIHAQQNCVTVSLTACLISAIFQQ